MPYMDLSLIMANHVLAPLENFDPAQLHELLLGSESLRDGAERLGLFGVIDGDMAEELRAHMDRMPPSMDAAIMAGILNALERGLRTQFVWQPAYAFGLQMWEVSDAAADPPAGTVTFIVSSPNPVEPTPR